MCMGLGGWTDLFPPPSCLIYDHIPSCLPLPSLQGESMMHKALAELKLWRLQREFDLSETSSQVQKEGWV